MSRGRPAPPPEWDGLTFTLRLPHHDGRGRPNFALKITGRGNVNMDGTLDGDLAFALLALVRDSFKERGPGDSVSDYAQGFISANQDRCGTCGRTRADKLKAAGYPDAVLAELPCPPCFGHLQ